MSNSFLLLLRRSLQLAFMVAGASGAVTAQAPNAYYVDVGGADASTGSLTDPFATLSHALTVIVPGDTIYVRGGTFEAGATIRVDQSGTDSARVHIFDFPGESPIIDFTGTDQDGLDIRGSHVHVRGLTLENAGHSGLFVKGGTGNIIERVTTRYNRNSGLQVEDGASNTLILNTDSYGNYDPDNNGENADGFAIKFDVGPGNVLRGCRAWDNSDDGFDFWEAGEGVTVESSWSFRNGINNWEDPDFQGDSNGFKLGHGAGAHRLVRNLAWGHLKHGFDVNGNVTGVTLFNNTAFNNQDRNFYFDEDNPAHVLRNNISLSGDVLMFAAIDDSNNSWNGFNAGGVDFLSLNEGGAAGPRSPDGGLPDMDFLHLRTDSKLVDAGIDVGIPFQGAAPDLGAFETAGAGVSIDNESVPRSLIAFSNYPNPFSTWTNFVVEFEDPSSVRIEIFDAAGRKIATPVDGFFRGGRTVIPWSAERSPISGGIYFARLKTASHVTMRAIVFRASDHMHPH